MRVFNKHTHTYTANLWEPSFMFVSKTDKLANIKDHSDNILPTATFFPFNSMNSSRPNRGSSCPCYTWVENSRKLGKLLKSVMLCYFCGYMFVNVEEPWRCFEANSLPRCCSDASSEGTKLFSLPSIRLLLAWRSLSTCCLRLGDFSKIILL